MNHSFHIPAWFNVFSMVFEGVITLFNTVCVFSLIVFIVNVKELLCFYLFLSLLFVFGLFRFTLQYYNKQPVNKSHMDHD